MTGSVTLTPPFQTMPQLLAFLDSLDASVMKLGTDRIEKVLALLGHPQDQVPTLHVAGTNGKGSTCAMMEAIYRASGFTTGLFISPHLVDVRERIQCQGAPIAEADFLEAAQAVYQAMVEALPEREDWLTYFEYLCAMAFWHFAQVPVDLAVIETGMGGRLDGTNVIARPEAAVLTPIAMDHVARLGPTLKNIAGEKAGIFKPGVPVVTAVQESSVMTVLKERAKVLEANLVVGEPEHLLLGGLVETETACYREVGDETTGCSYFLNLLGRYQVENLAVVFAVRDLLQSRFPVPLEALKMGLQLVNWPARFQYFPRQRLVIDGSHNAHGIQSLLDSLKTDFPGVPIHWGLTLLANREVDILAPLLAYPLTQRVHILKAENTDRFHPVEAFQSLVKENHHPLEVVWGETPEAFCAAPAMANPLKILTGSLYTAGAVLETLSAF